VSLIAQQTNPETPSPSISDNAVLDEFEIPFGQWIDQAVDWTENNLEPVLNIIEWPFDQLISVIVVDTLKAVSWVWVALAFFVIGTLSRNLKVGTFAAIGLGICGILGNAYWIQTAATIGFIGVAVFLCAIIGIPLGIACGRIDGVWNTVRPVLDAMQVVHSFVYMLPFVYFFGIGEVSATMVTMVFALPPLVRLTNLGIRQVPSDVVEASRAYGAPERRVLFDVQFPLARPAIMTGINQTLLLAISMLAIAAIMGAGGLGTLLFRAIQNQDVAAGGASGLAFFLVAVILDRISQRDGDESGGLLKRIRLAWAHRRDPETLLKTHEPNKAPAESDIDYGKIASISSSERVPMVITAAGALLTVLSVLLPWTSGGGFLSAYGRRTDETLVGESFNGLAASGGSWVGILVAVLGSFVLLSVAITSLSPGRGPRWLTADGAVIAALAVSVMMAAYFLARPSHLAVGQNTGSGAILALIGSVIATIGAVWWIQHAPHSPLHPISDNFSWGQVFGAVAASLLIGVGAISIWSYDIRGDVIITPEVQAQIDDLLAKSELDPRQSSVYGAQVSTIYNSLKRSDKILISGTSSEGTSLGTWAYVTSLVALGSTLLAAGVMSTTERFRWRWNTITAGFGAGIVCIAFAWIATHVRSADDNYFSGVGSFLVLVGGVVLVSTTLPVLREFRRAKIFKDTDDETTLPRNPITAV